MNEFSQVRRKRRRTTIVEWDEDAVDGISFLVNARLQKIIKEKEKIGAFENCNCETFAQQKRNETCGLLFSSSEHDSLVCKNACKSPVMGKLIFSFSIKSLKRNQGKH